MIHKVTISTVQRDVNKCGTTSGDGSYDDQEPQVGRIVETIMAEVDSLYLWLLYFGPQAEVLEPVQ